MVSICAQPDDLYFYWQVEVLINNFRKFGLSDKMHILLFKPADRKYWNSQWQTLEERYPEVKFFRYEDQGANIKGYIPILRPHILKQHFAKFPELSKETIFYHDSDILLTKNIDFDKLSKGDTWYMSDTTSYISYSYFKSKEKDVKPNRKQAYNLEAILNPLLHNIGLTTEQLEKYDSNSGGAQYILKGVDEAFWTKVEKDCNNIRFYLQTQNRLYFDSEDKGFQSWCADMWAVLWNGIALNKDIKITDELSFSWATDKIEEWSKHPIYHNAGVTNEAHLFNKGLFHNNRTSPFEQEITGISKDYASYMYFQEIMDVKDKYYKTELNERV
jgi:hypothetical protein